MWTETNGKIRNFLSNSKWHFFFFLVVVELEVLKEVDMYKWVVVCLLNLIGNGFLGLNFRAELGLLI